MAESKSNTQVADLLERIADLLEAQNANPFRMRAYHEGAQTVRNLDQPAADFVEKNRLDALTELPNIGKGIAARTVQKFVRRGNIALPSAYSAKIQTKRAIEFLHGRGFEYLCSTMLRTSRH
jgi:DNA polymerase (family X)